jgi:hypothetical protein
VTPALPGLRRQLRPGCPSRSLLWRCVVRFVGIDGYDRALGLAAQGAWLGGLGGTLVLAATVAAGAALATVVQGFDGAGPLVFLLRALVPGILWLLAIRLLLGWSLPWRPYVPGAVVAGAGTALIWLLSGVCLPRAFIFQAAAYGLIGIVVVLISRLILLALLLVVAAVVSAELWHSRPTAPAGPAVPGCGPAGPVEAVGTRHVRQPRDDREPGP